ncbi:MAG: hypothetical protein U5L45_15140 [Saprospiraceae bacterium]|nr:hypothetical protein [Saprospiraceae bacterium]
MQIEALELLDKYFKETSESAIKADIQAVTELSFVGSSAKDYFSLFHKYLNYEPFERELEISSAMIAVKHPIEYSMLKMNTLSDNVNLASVFLYFKHIKSNIYPLLEYNHLDTNKNKMKHYEKNNFSFNLTSA